MIKPKKTRFIIGGLLIIGTLVYLGYSGMQGSMVYYLTVNELMARAAADQSIYGEGVRVSGKVVSGSIERDSMAREIKFKIIDNQGNGGKPLPVFYRGTPPDLFKNGVDVVVEGEYTRDGTFLAKTLLTSCPSKYEPAKGEKAE